MAAPGALTKFIQAHLEDAGTQWSLGTFGAIAEFMRTRYESVELIESAGSLAVSTARGAMRLQGVDRAKAVASETASSVAWNHRVALCLPEADCAMGRRSVVTELGLDHGAVRIQDRESVLFDLGLAVLQADICIRTDDRALIAALRSGEGRSIFDPASSAFSAVLHHSPHRVFICRLGRIEVFQPIPPTHGTSPEGPHTHVLPKLLRHGLTHPVTEPIPAGWVPCVHLYPAHPAKDYLGKPRDFDGGAHESFQSIFANYGDPQMVELKRHILAALRAGFEPERIEIPDTRAARNLLRVAVLQWKAMSDTGSVLVRRKNPRRRRKPEAIRQFAPAQPSGSDANRHRP